MTVHALKTGAANLRAKVSAEEWQARVDLAACYRLMDLYEMTDLIANHISMRVPGEPDHFLINAYGMLYEEITASSLIKIDHEGNVLAKPDFGPGLDYGVNRAGFVIHSAIHMARHDVECVAHTHNPAGMAGSAMECGLLPLAQTSMRFLHIPHHAFEGIADDLAERERLVSHTGDPEDLLLVEGLRQLRVERVRRSQVMAEGLLDDDPAGRVTLTRQTRQVDSRQDVAERVCRRGEVEDHRLGAGQHHGQLQPRVPERCRGLVHVERDHLQHPGGAAYGDRPGIGRQVREPGVRQRPGGELPAERGIPGYRLGEFARLRRAGQGSRH